MRPVLLSDQNLAPLNRPGRPGALVLIERVRAEFVAQGGMPLRRRPFESIQ